MSISISALLALARAVEGEPILTLQNRRLFRIAVLENDAGLEIVPSSSNRPRREPRAQIEAILSTYGKTGSLRKADYSTISFNASYVLALIKHFTDQEFSTIALSADKIDQQFARNIREAKKLTDAELQQRLMSSPGIPQKVTVTTTAYLRNQYVVIAVLKRAKGICEACGEKAPFLRAKDNEPYLEVHHSVQLANGGKDNVENALALCPNCHRKAHFGKKDA